MGRFNVSPGTRFGRLVVVDEAPIYRQPNGKVRRRFVCKCDCGNEVTIALGGLRNAGTSSCGCLQRETTSKVKSLAVTRGDRYGRLVVIKEAARHRDGCRCFLCRCDCGSEVRVKLVLLRTGGTQSCGCLQKELAAARRRADAKHGMEGTPTYRSWSHMKSRCTNPHHKYYRHYGGRGITICQRWMDSFEAFLEDMGERPSMKYSIDRIDNDGNYEPGNCRWATWKEQARNSRNNRTIAFRGRVLCVTEWAEVTGIDRGAIFDRLNAGWSVEESLTLPVQRGRRRI